MVNDVSEENFGYPKNYDFNLIRSEDVDRFRKMVPPDHKLLEYFYPLLKDCDRS